MPACAHPMPASCSRQDTVEPHNAGDVKSDAKRNVRLNAILDGGAGRFLFIIVGRTPSTGEPLLSQLKQPGVVCSESGARVGCRERKGSDAEAWATPRGRGGG